jgi:energy-coupling factor transporter ATP-binding protein EcfA2
MPTSDTPATSPAQQPPYLKHVRLRNVPPLRDVSADFKPGLNVIIGKNGSGKTNFLKLVGELADLNQEKLKGVGCELLLDIDGEEVSVEFKENEIGKRAERIPASLRNLPPIMSGVSRQHTLRNTPLMTVATINQQTIKEENLFVAIISLSSSINFGRFGFGYDILSIWHGLPNHPLAIIDKGTDVVFSSSGGMSITSETGNPWQQMSVLERALFNSIVPYDVGSPTNDFASIEPIILHQFIARRIASRLNILNAYLPIYSPIQQVRLGEQFQVYPNSARDEVIVKGLMLEYLVADDWLPFSALSDGTKRIFHMLGELTMEGGFLNEDDSVSDLANDKIILLEEPELGIHPDQLQLLLQLIREVSREHQVILTTHSPQALDMLNRDELDRITVCEYVPGKGTQMRKLSAAKQAKARAYLKDEGFLSEFWRFSNLEDPD